MSVIVSDTGFAADDWTFGFQLVEHLPANDGAVAIDLPSDADLTPVARHLDRIDLIRIDFPTFADGRGFTLARQVRRMGFAGRLRAKGHVIADQYAMARRSGFDEVEIDKELAERQPEDQWLARADWRSRDYRARLRA